MRIFNALLLVLILIWILAGCSGKKTVLVEYEPGQFIHDWLICGPFPNCEDCDMMDYKHSEKCVGFYTDYLASIGGELLANPTAGQHISIEEKGIDRKWTRAHRKSLHSVP